MKTLLLLYLFTFSFSVFSKSLAYVEDSSVLLGNIQGHERCAGEESQVFIARKGIVYYQIPVPSFFITVKVQLVEEPSAWYTSMGSCLI